MRAYAEYVEYVRPRFDPGGETLDSLTLNDAEFIDMRGYAHLWRVPPDQHALKVPRIEPHLLMPGSVITTLPVVSIGPGVISDAGTPVVTIGPGVITTVSTGTPGASLSAGTLTFASTTVGTPAATQTIVVTNTGTANLVITAVSVTGDFSETGP